MFGIEQREPTLPSGCGGEQGFERLVWCKTGCDLIAGIVRTADAVFGIPREAAVAMRTTPEAPTAADSPGPESLDRRRMNLVFVTILGGMLLAALDQTIVSTALPTIVGDLGGAGHLSWVVSSYLLADTIATVLAGKFGDQFGRKRLFQLAAATFVVASALCGLAGGLTWLIAWRAVQGFAAGFLMVTATAVIADIIPLRERGKYQGALGAVSA